MQLICGVFYLDGRQAHARELELMLGALTPRNAPSQRTTYVAGAVGLARLSAREAVADANMPRSAHGCVLTADCRLDAEPGHPVMSEDDLLTLLESENAKQLGQVLGDFALAAWDPVRGRLTCSRDGMGARPLFYVHRPGSLFAFASRPAALLAAGFAAPELDPAYLTRWLQFSPSGPSISLFRHVRRVPPGTSLLVTRDRLDTRIDWRLSEDLIGTGPRDPDAAAEELARLLTEAVRCRVAGEQPIATHLSGGLDSSAVTLLAARVGNQSSRMHAYSMLPSEAWQDDPKTEWPFVKAVLAKAPGLPWSPIFSGEGMAFMRPAMDSDQIVPVSSGWPDTHILERAAADGAVKLLSGWGGDEGASFNGRGVFLEALIRGQWLYLARVARPGARRLTAEVMKHVLGHATMHRLRSAAGLPALTPREKTSGGYLLNPQLLPFAAEPASLPNADSGGLRYALLSSSHLWERAETWNLNAAHHGLTMLFPLLDRRVVELAVSVPGSVFIRDDQRRWLFRHAMRGVLPPQLIDRPSKFRPIDDVYRILQQSFAEVRAWVAGLGTNERVTACLDVQRIESELDAVKGRATAQPGLVRALRLAAFLEQRTEIPAVRAG